MLALGAVAFVPTTNNDINTSITTHIEDLSGAGPVDGLINLNVTAVNELLLLSTTGSVNSAPGLDSWDASTIFGFDPDDNGLGSNTNGMFSELFDLDLFASNASVDALHFVSQDISVGTGSGINLLAGDGLFSVSADITLTNSDLTTLDVKKEDVVIFRPDVAGDYSTGSFSLLFSNPSGNNIESITLAEEETLVGDIVIQAGSFLFTEGSTSIYIFTPDDLSISSSNGNVERLIDGGEESLYGDGNDIFPDNIIGIELVENEYTIAGTTLQAGTLLITTDGNGNVSLSDTQSGKRQDIYALNLTQTTLGSGSTDGSVSLFFDGSNVSLNNNSASLNAISFVESQTVANTAPTGNVVVTGNLTEDQILTADTSEINDSDGLGSLVISGSGMEPSLVVQQ
ncbi:hypothetical protein ACLKMH_01070 [Psychromonas sp. KJ10-10]|uniref:hypothetical protein n=1 Tax=Psychromonas sp. KJ10-10 TaxID=3391823 RepID=UPI0039B53DE5